MIYLLVRKPIFYSPTVTHQHPGLCHVPGQNYTHTLRKLSQQHRWHLASAKSIEATQPTAGLCLMAHSMPTSVHACSPLETVTHLAIFSNLENLVWDAFRHLYETQLLLQWQAHLLDMRKRATYEEPTQGKSTEMFALRIKAWGLWASAFMGQRHLGIDFLPCTCSHVAISPQSEWTIWVQSAGFSAPWQLNIQLKDNEGIYFIVLSHKLESNLHGHVR